MANGFFNQGIQADASGLSGCRSLGVQIGGNTYHEFSAGLFSWLNAVFGTRFQKEIKACFTQSRHSRDGAVDGKTPEAM